MSLKTFKTSVLIVGSGPVGITLNLLLSRMRIPSILVDKHPVPRKHPRAHYLSNRSMEIWRQLGHFDKALESAAEPLEYWRYFKYCRHIIDPHANLYAVKDHFGDHYRYNGTYFEELSPSKICNFPQHKLLFFFKSLALDRSQLYKKDRDGFTKWLENEYKLVLEKSRIDAEKTQRLLGLERPLVLPDVSDSAPEQIRTNVPFIDGAFKFERFVSKEKGILSRVRDVRTGSEFNVESLFVVGADGIHSSVARALFGERKLNENVKDTSNLKEVMSVHFESRQLGEYVSSNPAMMYFIFSECVCVMVCQGGDPPEFVVQIPFFPEFESTSLYDEKNCASLINEAVGTELRDLKIHKIKRWTVTTNVTPSFIDQDTSRIFLAGDAAHLVAPAGGLGMNMGIADSHNLAWKLSRFLYRKSQDLKINDFDRLLDALFESGLNEQDKKFLNEYSVERKAVAEYTRDVCLKEVENGSKFAKYLGYNHGSLQKALDVLAPIMPHDSHVIPYVFNSVKAFMKYAYNTPKRMDDIANFSKELLSKMDGSLGLRFPGSDLAYSYNFGDLKTSKSHRHYWPQSLMGMRIPHRYFYSQQSNIVYKISTVDLPSLMQPPIYYCVLVFDRKMIKSVLSELDLNLYYICLWETGVSVGSGDHVTVDDQFISKPNTLINSIGLDSEIDVIDEKLDDHFIFNKLEDSSDFEHFDYALNYVSKMPNGLVKKVFSNKETLDAFSRSLFGNVTPLNNTYLVLRPDSHIFNVKTVNL
nr:mono-oxygenase [Theileria orientalis]